MVTTVTTRQPNDRYCQITRPDNIHYRVLYKISFYLIGLSTVHVSDAFNYYGISK